MAQADMLDKKLFNKDRKDTKDVRGSRPPPDDVRSAGAGGELLVFTVPSFPREE